MYYQTVMRRKSKLADQLRKELLESARRMTPEERLAAYAEHSRLVMEIYRSGVAARSKKMATKGKSE